MRDGNKEAAKELLSTFRVVFTTSVSIILVVANLRYRNEIQPGLVLNGSLGLLAVSAAASVWLSLIVLRMLHQEAEDIAYKRQVRVLGSASMTGFALGVVILTVSQFAYTDAPDLRTENTAAPSAAPSPARR